MLVSWFSIGYSSRHHLLILAQVPNIHCNLDKNPKLYFGLKNKLQAKCIHSISGWVDLSRVYQPFDQIWIGWVGTRVDFAHTSKCHPLKVKGHFPATMDKKWVPMWRNCWRNSKSFDKTDFFNDRSHFYQTIRFLNSIFVAHHLTLISKSWKTRQEIVPFFFEISTSGSWARQYYWKTHVAKFVKYYFSDMIYSVAVMVSLNFDVLTS